MGRAPSPTFPYSPPLWIPASAGTTNWGLLPARPSHPQGIHEGCPYVDGGSKAGRRGRSVAPNPRTIRESSLREWRLRIWPVVVSANTYTRAL